MIVNHSVNLITVILLKTIELHFGLLFVLNHGFGLGSVWELLLARCSGVISGSAKGGPCDSGTKARDPACEVNAQLFNHLELYC